MSKNRGLRVFQAGRHIVMGLLLMVLAWFLVENRKFGQLELSAMTAYVLAGLLVIYGLFRIWRGTRELKERNVDDFIS
jgi:ABC-type nickel/cobalt efflux system permease component RcnA